MNILDMLEDTFFEILLWLEEVFQQFDMWTNWKADEIREKRKNK